VTQKYAKNTNNNIRLQQNVVAGHKLPAVLLFQYLFAGGV
jgi:hypothetical protein